MTFTEPMEAKYTMETEDRKLANQTIVVRLYEDDFDELATLCGESGREPDEAVRDAVAYWLRLRRSEDDSHEFLLDFEPYEPTGEAAESLDTTIERVRRRQW